MRLIDADQVIEEINKNKLLSRDPATTRCKLIIDSATTYTTYLEPPMEYESGEKSKKLDVNYIEAIIAIILTMILLPALTFGFAYLGGIFLNWIVGAKLIKGLNLMFHTTRFTRELIPLTCATLAVIGSYFKSYKTD